MELDTKRFGVIEVDDQAVITFTQPIIGFQEFRRYLLLDGPPESNVQWLQSIDSGDLAFILMDPRNVVPDYTIKLGAHELSEMAVTTVEELDVYTLVVVPQDASKTRTNLKAPIVINPKQRLAKQTILDKSSYLVQYLLAQSQSQEEVDNARPNA
ncbi:MAG: flagellar assembly protein FliW [Candidatus Hydrogenedentota bacterium]